MERTATDRHGHQAQAHQRHRSRTRRSILGPMAEPERPYTSENLARGLVNKNSNDYKITMIHHKLDPDMLRCMIGSFGAALSWVWVKTSAFVPQGFETLADYGGLGLFIIFLIMAVVSMWRMIKEERGKFLQALKDQREDAKKEREEDRKELAEVNRKLYSDSKSQTNELISALRSMQNQNDNR